MKNEETIIKELLDNMGVAERINRKKVSDFVIENKELFPSLLKIVFETNYELHHKAAWTLEFILEEHLEWILPHLTIFTSNISRLSHQSAIRPIAKICKWIAVAHSKQKNTEFKKGLKNTHITKLVEACFDWLIGEHKVASKAYSMISLYHFGKLQKKEFKWIHMELKKSIEQNIYKGSPAYKSQGMRILGLLKQLQIE